MRSSRLLRLIPLLLGLLCLTPTLAQDLARQNLLLTFIPNVQFSPFYVGIADGYFADAGFDVTLQHLQEPEVVDLVAAGQADFGVVSGEQVILARSRGRDVVTIFEWFQQYPVGLIARDAESVSDLSGRKVGLPGRFGASYTGLSALLASNDMSEVDIDLQEIGFNAPEVFCLGAVAAAVVYINNEPIQIRGRQRDGQCGESNISVFAVADAVDLVSNGLITRADLLATQPDTAARMAEAYSLALAATISNPAHAYLVSLDFVDSLPASDALREAMRQLLGQQERFLAGEPSRDEIRVRRGALLADLADTLDAAAEANITQFEILLRSIDLWDAARLGYSDLESWAAMRDTLHAMGILDAANIDLEPAFSNRYLPGDDA